MNVMSKFCAAALLLTIGQPALAQVVRRAAPASSAFSALVDALGDVAPSVRAAAAHALGETHSTAALAALSVAASDPAAGVRRQVAWAFGEINDESAAPALITLSKDDDVDVRRHVAHALKELTEGKHRELPDDRSTRETTLDVLLTMSNDVDPHVRHYAIGGLGQFRKTTRDDTVVAALARATLDSEGFVRHAAAMALSENGGADALAALAAMIKDPDPHIRSLAVNALGRRR